MLARSRLRRAAVDVTADDGVRHQLWVDQRRRKNRRPHARGRCLAGALHRRRPSPLGRGGARRGKARGGEGSHTYFLTVLFPQSEMTILDYNRVLRDLNGRTPEQLLAELRRALRGRAERSAGAARRCRRSRHVSRRPLVPAHPATRRRAARRDPATRSSGCRSRCSRATSSSRFSASPIRAPTSASTSSAAAAGWPNWNGWCRRAPWRSAFALYPTQMSDLMAVADAGAIMPPKSTWFEPKLADGMVSHVLD